MANGAKRSVKEAALRRAALDAFFALWGDKARCQICGRPLRREEADACHKIRAGQGGPSEPRNLVAGHGFRAWPGCHRWADAKPSRYHLLRDDPANLENGLIVEWSSEQKQSLRLYLQTGTDPLRSP